jgi:type IV secretory pathway component VirB8
MPTILRWKGYRFFFFSNEGDPFEPLHVHVRKDTSVAKFWLEPYVRLAESYGIKPHELNKLQKIIERNTGQIKRAWYEYFSE